jgi:hypothetical protein
LQNNQLRSGDPHLSDSDLIGVQDELSSSLRAIEDSLQSQHPSVKCSTNPVLRNAQFDFAKHESIKDSLIQYCFLPAEIVNLLSFARQRLRAWPSLETELTRNIDEELGSRTNGISHYEILVRALSKELDLQINHSEQLDSTKRFLNSLKMYFLSSAESSVAGAIYGLENAAVPELTVVATLINHFSMCSSLKKTVIDLPAQRSCFKNEAAHYNLNTFFAMHLLDFEVGHKNGLALAIKKQHSNVPLNLHQLKAGFEFVLNQMDEWWEDLASLITEKQL